MSEKCKSCPKREDCNILPSEDESRSEQEQLLNLLSQFEQSICRTIDFTLNGRGAGLQWLFFKMMSNKFRDIAKQIEPYVIEIPDIDIDWDVITSIEQLADDYKDEQDKKSQDRDSDWFSGDIKGV